MKRMKEKVLDMIALVPITNRDQLIDELAALDGEALYAQLADNRATRRIDDLRCEVCKQMYDEVCGAPDDDACLIPIEVWLDMPCERERLLEVDP